MSNVNTITISRGKHGEDEWRVSYDQDGNGVHKEITISIPCLGDYEGSNKSYDAIIDQLVSDAVEMSRINE